MAALHSATENIGYPPPKRRFGSHSRLVRPLPPRVRPKVSVSRPISDDSGRTADSPAQRLAAHPILATALRQQVWRAATAGV